jgi:hypothetical protein
MENQKNKFWAFLFTKFIEFEFVSLKGLYMEKKSLIIIKIIRRIITFCGKSPSFLIDNLGEPQY